MITINCTPGVLFIFKIISDAENNRHHFV